MNTICDKKLSRLMTVAIIPVSVSYCYKCRSGEGFVLLIMLKECVGFGRPWEVPGTTNNDNIPELCPCCSH